MRPSVRMSFCLLQACSPLAAQEKFTLRYKFEPGQVVWTQMTQDQTQVRTMQGKDAPVTTSVRTTMWMESKTAEVKDGVATIESRYARIVIKSDSPELDVDYDSDVEGSKPGAMKPLADLVGKTAKLRADTTGKILDVTLPTGLDKQMEEMAASLKQGFEQQFTAWPPDAIGIGDTWQNTLEMPMGPMGSMKATITNKLLAMKDQVATVEMTMAMDTSGLKMPGGFTMEVSKAGGVSRIGLASPMPLDATMELEMKIGSKSAGFSMVQTQKMAMKQVPAPAPKKPAEPAKEEPKKDEPKKGDGK